LREHARDLFLLDLVRQVGGRQRGRRSRCSVRGAGERLASRRCATLVLESQIGARYWKRCSVALRSRLKGSSAARSAPRQCCGSDSRRVARRALVDRREGRSCWSAPRCARRRRRAASRFAPRARLEPLVEAARASLREEGRPDPFIGDPRGFRRWVSARLPRALIAECAGEVVWVGYADVRIEEGWLLQGIYPWPAWRLRGLAAAGVTALCQIAFAEGAEHVQLSVVDGNDAARALYEGIGFKPFARLRTILFD
jgi:RimJ/RimL family protein N-acetyltransferase